MQFTDDTQLPDYIIFWYEPETKLTGRSTVFSYGKGEMYAIAGFVAVNPRARILEIHNINQNLAM